MSKEDGIVPELNGIRGISVLAVVVFHCGVICGFQYISWSGLLKWGWVGVEIFFILSGFLITGILLRTRHSTHYWRNFIMRRALRIFPAYYTVLILVWFVVPHLSAEFAESDVSGDLLTYLLYLQNWDHAINGWPDWGFVAHFWSLAVEEQFYLFWPLVVIAVSQRTLSFICVLMIAVALAFKVAAEVFHLPSLMSYTATISQLDALAAGSWVACQTKDGLRFWFNFLKRPLIALLIVIVIGACVARLIPGGARINIQLLAIIFSVGTLMLIGVGKLPRLMSAVLSNSVLGWFGRYSYGIYLLHYPLLGLLFNNFGEAIGERLESSPDVTVLLVIALTVAGTSLVALVMFHIIEQPALKAKRFFEYRGAANVSV